MAIGKKYTRRASKHRRKTKKRRGGVRGYRRPTARVADIVAREAAAASAPRPPIPPALDKADIIRKVTTGETGVNADMFMAAKKELMQIARYDLVTNKEYPFLFNRITEYGMRVTGGGSVSPARWRGHWVYNQCLECDHVNSTDNFLPEFQVTKDRQEPTNIPHTYDSILWHSICQAGGRSDPRLGQTHSGYLPCWYNKKFDPPEPLPPPPPPPVKRNLTPEGQSILQKRHEDEIKAVDDILRNITTKDNLGEQLTSINNTRIPLNDRRRPELLRSNRLLTKLNELYEKLQPELADSGLDDQQIMVLAKNELKRFVDRDPMFRSNFMIPQTPNRLDVFED